MVGGTGWKNYFRDCDYVCLDTSVLIYLFQDHKKYSNIVDRMFQFFEAKKVNLYFSSLLLTELLVDPFRKHQPDVARDWLSFFKVGPNLDIIDLSPSIAVDAAYLRARYNIKTPDSIHLATAMQREKSIFLTNDQNLKKLKEVKVVCVEDLIC